jgi:hypothetical protein
MNITRPQSISKNDHQPLKATLSQQNQKPITKTSETRYIFGTRKLHAISCKKEQFFIQIFSSHR